MRRRLFLFLPLLLVAGRLAAQGPPFQVDDPEPVDFQHYEFYLFGGMDGTPVEIDSTGPAFEFNWGALPRVQLHAVLPMGAAYPLNNTIYAPSGQGPSAFGLTDMETGVKVALLKQSKSFPQVGIFPMFELPTGNADKGLGVGKVWYKLPLWAEKDWERWTVDGGAGEALNSQDGFRNYPYGGLLVRHEFNKRLDLAAEIFAHGGQGAAAAQTEASVLADVGYYYRLKGEAEQLLFAYGHSVAGQTENYAYLGFYWTWGKKSGR